MVLIWGSGPRDAGIQSALPEMYTRVATTPVHVVEVGSVARLTPQAQPKGLPLQV